ncbi:unnamed protein product, partial [Prorocentrum cordatum]
MRPPAACRARARARAAAFGIAESRAPSFKRSVHMGPSLQTPGFVGPRLKGTALMCPRLQGARLLVLRGAWASDSRAQGLGRLALLLHLGAAHLALFRLWYGCGLRKAFTTMRNTHYRDLRLAVRIAEGGAGRAAAAGRPEAAAAPEGRLALLFMLRGRLDHLEAWRGWLEPEAGREPAARRVSLYFHLADGSDGEASQATVSSLLSLPCARQVVATVATGWCELMAAEVALYQVPLVTLDTALARLLRRPHSRFCLAGVRGLEVPSECSYAMEPHWDRALLLKHHQWTVLSRVHAARLADARALGAAARLFEDRFLGEPLCSDELLPILTLAMPNASASSLSGTTRVEELPLHAAATRGIQALEDGLAELGAAAECSLYAPWPGCSAGLPGKDRRAKSPVAGGGLEPAERDRLMLDLAARGVVFGRKLGLGGPGGWQGHLALIGQQAGSGPAGAAAAAPARLLPGGAAGLGAPRLQELLLAGEPEALWRIAMWLRWGLSTAEALVKPPLQVAIATALCLISGKVAMKSSGISELTLTRLMRLYVGIHLVVFLVSIT